MIETARQRRAAELRELQRVDPRSIIDLYGEITGRFSGGQLPHQTSFTLMISAILDREYGPDASPGDTMTATSDKLSHDFRLADRRKSP
jgi:hypothetical protein